MIGKRLKELREQKNRLQKEVAEALGMSQRGYGQWEAEITEPNMERVKQLAEYFKVPVSYFYGEDYDCPVDPIRKLLNELIDKKIITDPSDIEGSVADLILNAVKQDLIMQKINRETGQQG